jgi:hypothetical protein
MHALNTTALTGSRTCRRLALAGALAAAAFVLLPAAPARAAGGCSVASAPLIASGTTETTDENACPDHYEYWAMNVKIGDTLTVNTTGTGSIFAGLDVYGPDVGTIGGTPQCGTSLFSPAQTVCLIGAAGRYVLAFHNATVSFTPVVKSVPPQRGRVAGACDVANAPTIPSGVTQYGNANLCAASGSYQYWAIDLLRGDSLKVDLTAIQRGRELEVFGPGVGTIGGTPLCSASEFGGPSEAICHVRASGRYVLVSEQSTAVSFTPVAVHPTQTDVTARVQQSGAIRVAAVIHSNRPHARGTCVIQERSGARWVPLDRVHTRTGVCRASVEPTHQGLVHLRIRFIGELGWASSTSRPITVHVPSRRG